MKNIELNKKAKNVPEMFGVTEERARELIKIAKKAMDKENTKKTILHAFTSRKLNEKELVLMGWTLGNIYGLHHYKMEGQRALLEVLEKMVEATK